MPEWSAPDRSQSRAVLIGTSEYDELTPIPAAANSLDRMHRLLTGRLCAWPEGRVTVLPNERVPGDLAHRLVQLYMAVPDVALFYYVGHGQIDDDDRLCLGLVGSSLQAEFRATTSLTFDAVRAALRRSRARVKIVILDCCFAGKALHGPHTLAGAADVAALAGATGAYTLAATGGYTTAWYEDDRDTPTPQTYFTKYLADIVERGIPGEATGLTLDPIYWRLREDLPAAGKPVPERITRDFADTFVFARNLARSPEAVTAPDAGIREVAAPTSPTPVTTEGIDAVLSAPTEPASAPDAGIREVAAPASSAPATTEGIDAVLSAPLEPSSAPDAGIREVGAPASSTPVTAEGTDAVLSAPAESASAPVPDWRAPIVWPEQKPSPAFAEASRGIMAPPVSGRNGPVTAVGPSLADLVRWMLLPQRSSRSALGGAVAVLILLIVMVVGRIQSSSAVILHSSHGAESVAFSPDGTVLAVGGSAGADLWDPTTGQISQTLNTSAGVNSLVFSPDGKILASGNADGTVQLWKPATGQPVGQPLTGHTKQVYSVAFSHDGKMLASGSEDGTVRLWNPATGQPVGQPLTGHVGAGVFSVAFSHDGNILAVGSSDNTVRLWNPATGQPIGQPLTGHTEGVSSVAFSPNDRILASASWDGTVRLWDPATGQLNGQPITYSSGAWGLAFSPDGEILAATGADDKVHLWNPATGQPIGQPLPGTGHKDTRLNGVAFGYDGKILASGSTDGTVLLWNPATGGGPCFAGTGVLGRLICG